jgi:hypothetical protein
MATIKELMPYLEQGCIAVDHQRIGPAYLHPKKQNDAHVFEWTAYEMEGEWSGPEIHSREYVLTWESDDWGILCHSNPDGWGSEDDESDPKGIEQAIANGRVYKAEGWGSKSSD